MIPSMRPLHKLFDRDRARVESMFSLRRRSNSAFFSCAACASDTIYHSHSAPVYPILKIQSISCTINENTNVQKKNTSQVCKPNLIQCNIYYYQTTHFFLNFTRYSCLPNFDSSLPNNPGLIFLKRFPVISLVYNPGWQEA